MRPDELVAGKPYAPYVALIVVIVLVVLWAIEPDREPARLLARVGASLVTAALVLAVVRRRLTP